VRSPAVFPQQKYPMMGGPAQLGQMVSYGRTCAADVRVGGILMAGTVNLSALVVCSQQGFHWVIAALEFDRRGRSTVLG